MAKSFEANKPPGGPTMEPPPTFQESQNAATSFRTRFSCITFNMSDRIRFINFPSSDVTALHNVVKNNWAKGIQRQGPYGAAHEIKLNGIPWSGRYHGDDEARVLVLRLLEALFDRGWVLQVAIDVSHKDFDKDSLLFRKQDPPPPRCDWISISFDKHDKLKIVGALPADLATNLIQTFGTKIRSHELMPHRLKIHFQGSPWWPSGEETVGTRMLLLTLLECLERFGFTVYASIDQQNSNDGRETDVLVCQRQRDWVPGAPIWHR